MAVNYDNLLLEYKPEAAHQDEQYRHRLNQLSALLLRDNLTEPEEKIITLLTLIIRDYEKMRFAKIEKASGIEVLKHLMEVQGLKNKDLVPSIFATTSIASATLRGLRDLTKKQLIRLSDRFGLSADVFIDKD